MNREERILIIIAVVGVIAVIIWETKGRKIAAAPGEPINPPEVAASSPSPEGLAYLTYNAPYGFASVAAIMPYATASATIPNGNQLTNAGGRF